MSEPNKKMTTKAKSWWLWGVASVFWLLFIFTTPLNIWGGLALILSVILWMKYSEVNYVYRVETGRERPPVVQQNTSNRVKGLE